MRYLILTAILLVGCEAQPPAPHSTPLKIVGRDGAPTYQIEVVGDWQIVLPDGDRYTTDTMLPLVELHKDAAKIVIHNFPGMSITPQAQVMRWKRQLKDTNLSEIEIVPVAWGGFEGLMLASPTVRAWAMQLAPEHERSLTWLGDETHEMRSPYTIKVTGPESELSLYQDEIERSVYSFELIDAIEFDR